MYGVKDWMAVIEFFECLKNDKLKIKNFNLKTH